MRLALLSLLLLTPALAQEMTLDPVAVPDEPPPESEPPPLPKADEDFSADAKHFGEVTTEAEKERERQVAEEQARVKDSEPMYLRYRTLDFVTEATAGIFAAGAVALLAGSIGDAIDPGDDRLPLGGAHGGLFGIAVGSAVGSTAGVWAGAQLFEKETPVGWTILGTSLGTLVGGGLATGILIGLEDEGLEGLAVTSYLVSQVGFGILFTHLFAPDPK